MKYKLQWIETHPTQLPKLWLRTFSPRSRIWSWTRNIKHPNIYIFASLQSANSHIDDYFNPSHPNYKDIYPVVAIEQFKIPTPSEVFEREEKRGLA